MAGVPERELIIFRREPMPERGLFGICLRPEGDRLAVLAMVRTCVHKRLVNVDEFGAEVAQEMGLVEMEINTTVEAIEMTPPSKKIEEEHMAAAMQHVDNWMVAQIQSGNRQRFNAIRRVAKAAQDLLAAAIPTAKDFDPAEADGEEGYGVGRGMNVRAFGGANDNVDLMHQMIGIAQPFLQAQNDATQQRLEETKANQRSCEARELADLLRALLDAPADLRVSIDARIRELAGKFGVAVPALPAAKPDGFAENDPLEVREIE